MQKDIDFIKINLEDLVGRAGKGIEFKYLKNFFSIMVSELDIIF